MRTGLLFAETASHKAVLRLLANPWGFQVLVPGPLDVKDMERNGVALWLLSFSSLVMAARKISQLVVAEPEAMSSAVLRIVWSFSAGELCTQSRW
jgi:hypothetical protein